MINFHFCKAFLNKEKVRLEYWRERKLCFTVWEGNILYRAKYEMKINWILLPPACSSTWWSLVIMWCYSYSSVWLEWNGIDLETGWWIWSNTTLLHLKKENHPVFILYRVCTYLYSWNCITLLWSKMTVIPPKFCFYQIMQCIALIYNNYEIFLNH